MLDSQKALASDADLLDWVAEEGIETPVFCLSTDVLRSGVETLRRELPSRISFATKANSHTEVLRKLVTLVDEFNVTNVPNLQALLSLGVPPERITWVHTVTPRHVLSEVLNAGVRRFVVDDMRGLDLLASSEARCKLMFRLRPPKTGQSLKSLVRFGTDARSIVDLARRSQKAGLEIEGISFFVGVLGAASDAVAHFLDAIDALSKLYAELERDGVHVPSVNIGGGFPGSRRRFHLDNPDFFRLIREKLAYAIPNNVTVVCEPGRFLVEPCMAIVSRVIADRCLLGRRLVYIEASAFGGLFEPAFIEPKDNLTIGVRSSADERVPADLLGPIMDSFDIIRRDCLLPPLREGELVLIRNVGAYAIGYTTHAEGIASPEIVQLPKHLDLAASEVWYD